MLQHILSASNKKKAVIGAAAVCIVAAGWHIYSSITAQPLSEKTIPLVRTITVGESDTSLANVYPGEVHGRYESNLAFQVTGKINSRPVNIGDTVQSGQILMTIDPKDVLQSVESSNAQLSSAAANQKLAADNAARYRQLYASGAVSQAVLDQYNTQLNAADAALRQAQAQVNTAANQLEYTNLRSDADGVVANITGEVGQIAAAGTPLVTVIRNGEREIQINVPENQLDNLHVGQPAQISFWALPQQAAGHIREISPIADPATKTYKICVAVDNLPAEAKLGMTAKVSFHTGSSKDILLPLEAIYQRDKQPQVWLVDEKLRVHLINVTIGAYSGNNVVITGGLKQGDKIVTAGINKLTEQQEVRLLKGGEG